MELGDNILRTL